MRGPKASASTHSLPRRLLPKPGVNPAPSITAFQRRGDRLWTRPPRIAGWWFSCPPPTFSQVLQPHKRNSDSCSELSRDPRAPVQQRQLPTHSLPQPPSTHHPHPRICIPSFIYCCDFLSSTESKRMYLKNSDVCTNLSFTLMCVCPWTLSQIIHISLMKHQI